MNINGVTGHIGLFGHPVAHTLSPLIHNTLSDMIGMNMCYTAFDVYEEGKTPDELMKTAVHGIYALGFKGVNVTVPYKEAVIPYLTEVDELAESIGAVNTLVRTADGYKGYNTDLPGLKRALEKNDTEIKGAKAVVLGAGGAARAVLVMLLKYQASKVYLVNRTVEKAEKLAAEITKACKREDGVIEVVGVNDTSLIPEDSYIFFQCTSLGLKPDDGLLVNDDRLYRMACYGFDLIYNPADTPFTKKMTELGIRHDNGLSMLLYQGIIAYEYWTGLSISDEQADAVYNVLCKKLYGDNVVLVGYMGAGKTTVGKELAKREGMSFIDTDEYIVETTGMTIPEIFEKSGEEGFRDIETRALRELSDKTYHTVIATGGGAVLRQENRDILRNMGRSFFLYASPEATFNRVKGDTGRPLLKSSDEDMLRKKIEDMLAVRIHAYRAAADTEIVTDSEDIDEIIENIKNFTK